MTREIPQPENQPNEPRIISDDEFRAAVGSDALLFDDIAPAEQTGTLDTASPTVPWQEATRRKLNRLSDETKTTPRNTLPSSSDMWTELDALNTEGDGHGS